MNFDTNTLSFLISNTQDPWVAIRAIEAMGTNADLPEPKVGLPPEWVLAQQARDDDERSGYAVRNCADPNTLAEIVGQGCSTAVLWEILRNPNTSFATLDLIGECNYSDEKIRQHLSVRRADKRLALERFEWLINTQGREYLLVGNVMELLEELVDKGHPECVERFFDFAGTTGFSWPLQLLLTRTYNLPRPTNGDPRVRSDSRIFEALSKSVFTLIDELYEAGAHQISVLADQLLVWLLSFHDTHKLSTRQVSAVHNEDIAPIPEIVMGPELASLIVKWVPQPPWLNMTLPTKWVTHEGADVLLASDYWKRALSPECLDDDQFMKVVESHPHPEWLIPSLRANEGEAAPRNRLEMIFSAMTESRLNSEKAVGVVLDSCYSQDDDLFVSLLEHASATIVMRYLAGTWMIMGRTVRPKVCEISDIIEQRAPIGGLCADDWSHTMAVCVSAHELEAPLDYCLELMDSVPGTALKLINGVHSDDVFFKHHLYQRLEDTGIGVEYALEQVLTHPEVPLRAMCKSLTLQASLVARGI